MLLMMMMPQQQLTRAGTRGAGRSCCQGVLAPRTAGAGARHAHRQLAVPAAAAAAPTKQHPPSSSSSRRHLTPPHATNNEEAPPTTSDSPAQRDAQQLQATSSSAASRLVLLAGLVGAAAAILVAAGGVGGLRDKVHDLEELIQASGYLGPLIYGGAYAAATVLLFPASVLTLAAGYLFGPLKGTAIVSASSTAGACLAFLVSRYLARPLVQDKLAGNPKFQAVYNNITADGAKLVLLLRLSPLVPFSLLNYGLGITQVRFADFALASWAGMLPGTFAYVYLGSIGKVAADAAADGSTASLDAAKVALYVVGAAATIWATKLISEAATKALDADQAAGDAQQ